MANFCSLCSKKIGVFTQIKIKDGYVCGDCQKKSLNMTNCNCRTTQDYKDRLEDIGENQKLQNIFSATIDYGDYIKIDENNKLFKLGKSPECFTFDCLCDFELIEDGETVVKGGLGRAVAGGLLFGGVGAIVGGVTGKKKNKAVVNHMYIRLSLNHKWVKDFAITLITMETKKNGFVYNTHKALADKIISALEIIAKNQPVADNNLSSADEILKFKQLLDVGAITDEEFTQKKKQLLGL